METNGIMGVEVSSLWIFALASFAACLLVLPVAMVASKRVGLLDHPEGRKTHKEPTPLVGGLSIFLAFVLVSFLLAGDWVNWSMFFWLSIVLVVGVLDDFVDLSYIPRILVHLVVVVGIWSTDGLMVESIGAIINADNAVTFSVVGGLCFTAVAVIGAINAVNMIDGVDGLLGTLVAVSLCSLLIISLFSANGAMISRVFSVTDIAILLGALVAFLLLNTRIIRRPSAKVYMGDAGSTLIGFLLVYLLIDFSHGDNAVIGPVVAGWILGMPLLDASAVICGRVLNKRSPVKPGRDHLHHFLLDRGLSVNNTVLLMAGAQVLMVLFAVSLEQSGFIYSDLVLFWGFVGLIMVRVALVRVPQPKTVLVTDSVGLKSVPHKLTPHRSRRKSDRSEAVA